MLGKCISRVSFFFIGLLCVLGIATNALSGEPSKALKTESNRPPETFIFLIDISGTMLDPLPLAVQTQLSKKSKLEEVKARVHQLIVQLPLGTKLIVSTFDHERKEIIRSNLQSDSERKSVLEKLSSISSRKGSTHLWRSADSELRRAKNMIEGGVESVRLIILSDGEDMEKNPKFTHKQLVENYSALIRNEITLDWVTIGFDLSSGIKKEFQGAGIRVVQAMDAEDLSPIRAGMSISKSVVTVGEPFTVDYVSSGNLVACLLDFNDGTLKRPNPREQSGCIEHRFERAGVYHCRFTVIARDGREESCHAVIKVDSLPWEPPQIEVDMATVTLDRPILFTAQTDKTDLRHEWVLPDGSTQNGLSIQWHPNGPGEFPITLASTDAAGTRKWTQRVIEVPMPVLPDPKIMAMHTVGYQKSFELRAVPIDPRLRYTWSVAKDAAFQCAEPVATYIGREPGSIRFSLKMEDAYGQSRTTEHTVIVEKPLLEAPEFDLVHAEQMHPGDSFKAIARIQTKEHRDYLWRVNGKEISTETEVNPTIESYGEIEVELTIGDRFGQTEKLLKRLHVRLPDPPVSSFLVSAEKVIEGDAIDVSNTTRGIYRTIRYEISAVPTGIVLSAPEQPDNKHRFLTQGPGRVKITQLAEGPGGSHRSSQTIEICRRWIAPKAEFRVSQREGVGAVEVHFLNRSVGDIEHCELDPGDGSPKIRGKGVLNLTHRYNQAGTYYPRITIFPPQESKLSSKEWQGESIVVIAPTPAWVKALVWQLPLLGLVVLGIHWGLAKHRAKKMAEADRCIYGELVIALRDNPLQESRFACDGSRDTYQFQLDHAEALKLSAALSTSGDLMYEVTLEDAGGTLAFNILQPNVEAEIGPYILRLETAM
jgi:PKD repeat protein